MPPQMSSKLKSLLPASPQLKKPLIFILILTALVATLVTLPWTPPPQSALTNFLKRRSQIDKRGGDQPSPPPSSSSSSSPQSNPSQSSRTPGQHSTVADPAKGLIGRFMIPQSSIAGNGSGVVGIHAALLIGTSKVVFIERYDYQGTRATFPDGSFAWSTEYDYTTDTFRPLKLRSNVFCGAGAMLPDGRILALGGSEAQPTLLEGEKTIRLLAPTGSPGTFGTGDWLDDPSNKNLSMAEKRWYPTTVPLPSGQILVIGGSDVGVELNTPMNNTASFEILPQPTYPNPTTPFQFLWDTLPANLYPVSAVLPSGRLFVFAGNRSTLMDHERGYNALEPFQIIAPNRTECIQAGVQVQENAFLWRCLREADVGFRSQNRTGGRSVQSFVGWPVLEDGWRPVEGGGEWIMNTVTKLCLEIVPEDGNSAKMSPCQNTPTQLFTLLGDSGSIFHPLTSLCLGRTPSEPISLTPCNSTSNLFSRRPTGAYMELPQLEGTQRSYPWTGFGALLPLDPATNYEAKILICGGSTDSKGVPNVNAPGLDSCGVIHPDTPRTTLDTQALEWNMQDRLLAPRVMGDLIHLPDGTVLLLNGCQQGVAGWDKGRLPSYRAELYNPTADPGSRWIPLNVSAIERMYHSSALLLPDGRVLVSGSAPNSAGGYIPHMYGNEYRVDYFLPPYLQLVEQGLALRPSIVSIESETELSVPVQRLRVGSQWSYNRAYNVKVFMREGEEGVGSSSSGREEVVEVNLIHSFFQTHSTGFGSRFVWLVSEREPDGSLRVLSPPNANIAPPGWYLCFVVVDGIPSIGEWIQLGGDPAGFADYPPGV
ncbi:hypothetical protein HDV05_003646 [Chytridiales sp. JEL 0842]|nr:hypothetical protein HDV05_003646 [Chytridiales sp. JEL 0842]